MKTSLAKRLAALLIGASALCAGAATPTSFNVMNINRTDGITERLLIDQKLDISLSEQGTLLLVHPQITVEYLVSEVETITFARDDSFTDLYDGDHQAGIEAPSLAENETAIIITDSEIRACGVADIELFDIKGVRISSCSAEAGVATLSIASLPKGIYIVKAGKSTLKVKI